MQHKEKEGRRERKEATDPIDRSHPHTEYLTAPDIGFHGLGILVECLLDSMTLYYRVEQKQEGNGPKDERARMALASKVKLDLRFELCDLNYPHIHVHIACNSQCHAL